MNKIFAYSQEKTRERALATVVNPTPAPTTIQPGVPVTFAEGPAVSITASGNGTKTQTTGLPVDVTTVTFKNGGAGNLASSATFAFDGTFEFAVATAATNTASGVEVFIIPASGALTLASAGNVHFGWTDYPRDYIKETGRAPVRIAK